ncbi:MAG: flagella cluster protein [Halobacteriaceae archaeon]
MTVIDVDDGFDVHEYRDRLKLRHQDADTYRFEVRGDLACPACGRPIRKLLVTTKRELTFDTGPDGPFCIVRTGGEELLVATHGG